MYEKLKKYQFEFVCASLALVGIIGLMVGYVFSTDFSQFSTYGGLVLNEKEQALLECLSDKNAGCLKQVQLVTYGQTTWETKNANVVPPQGVLRCYDGKDIYCDKYGGYYTFEEAKSLCKAKKMHLPTLEDFQYLYAVFGKNQDRLIFDMNLFPAGAIVWGESSVWVDKVARYWAEDLYNPKKQLYYGFTVGKSPVAGELPPEHKDSRFSVRCVKYEWE
ncbi:hypothetical protein CSB37_02165 [bacterium DOLZORAL124_38_8]|nr:MAG: hypothetical protein CSB37_02165 [bacterium DOLZORAL124_38_8]